MKTIVNDCGIRNSFGYVDGRAGEIILKRPCPRRSDLEDVVTWLETTPNLKKFSIGIGAVENFVIDDSSDTLYSTARKSIKKDLLQSISTDTEILKTLLPLVMEKDTIRNISLKCFFFSEDPELFALLMQVLRTRKNLVYLDLTGCYFTDEQLNDLATIISQSYIAHLIWPEPRMSPMLLEDVVAKFAKNKSIVVVSGVPAEVYHIAAENRNNLFKIARRPTMIGDNEAEIIHEYKESYRLAIAYEKQRLFDLEKAVEAILA